MLQLITSGRKAKLGDYQINPDSVRRPARIWQSLETLLIRRALKCPLLMAHDTEILNLTIVQSFLDCIKWLFPPSRKQRQLL